MSSGKSDLASDQPLEYEQLQGFAADVVEIVQELAEGPVCRRPFRQCKYRHALSRARSSTARLPAASEAEVDAQYAEDGCTGSLRFFSSLFWSAWITFEAA